MTTVFNYSVIAMVLFSLGLIGVISRRNIFIISMSIELMLNAVNLMLVAFSRMHMNMDGQVISVMIIAVAAAEAALFLTVMILLFKAKGSLDTDAFTILKSEPKP